MPIDPISADIDIINLALLRLGHATIVDIDENTQQAQLARATYDATRREMLEIHPWNFATQWVSLSVGTLPTAAAAKYDRAYDLPADMLRILEVEDQSAEWGDEWEVSNGQILTNLGGDTLRMRYIFNSTQVGRWSPSFINALAARLEQDWSEHLVKVSSVTDRKRENYETVLARGRTNDSAQATPRKVEASSWIRNR